MSDASYPGWQRRQANDMSWFTTRNLAHTANSKIEAAVLSLAHELRERRESVATAISRMTSKLKSEVESTKPGTIMESGRHGHASTGTS